MASQQQVKQYLAYWFQIGKKVVVNNGQKSLLPKTILQGDRYSSEFEQCWQQITDPASGDCYLEDTEQSITELLSPAWDMISCSRCIMPIPIKDRGVQGTTCPCYNLPHWPNTEVPLPRQPVDSRVYMKKLHRRLENKPKISPLD